ncbi:MAG: HlyC/CorC family transporter [Acidobacteriota bacterium]|nr:MAG: HlyC/CorC family transporter [Acidobacteriota bacterium]
MDGLNYQLALVAAALFLVFLNGFFVAAEFSIVKVRSTRIEELIKTGKKRATHAQKLVQNMDEYLSATQLGITLASLGLGWIGEPAFAELFQPLFARSGFLEPILAHSLALATAFALITFLHIVLGELAPKSLAIQLPEPVVLATSVPMILFYKLSYPMIWSLNSTANAFLRVLGFSPASEAESAHSEEELRMLLAHSKERGILDHDEQQILERVFEFGDRSVRQIMVPANEVIYLDTGRSLEENLAIAQKYQHTRYPLCEGSLDRVIGIIHVKDILWRQQEPAPQVDLESIMRPVRFVPESKLIKPLLNEFRKSRTHLSVVVDEYGSAVGIVALEDVLEELVGEIQDEFDSEIPKPSIQRLSDRRYIVDGRTLIEELEQKLEIQIVDDENDTIAGHVMTLLGRTASVGDEVTVATVYRVKVIKTKNLQITDLSFERIQ